MNKPNPCPQCGSDNLGIKRYKQLEDGNWPTCVYCGDCKYHGPVINTNVKATWVSLRFACEVTGWNKIIKPEL